MNAHIPRAYLEARLAPTPKVEDEVEPTHDQDCACEACEPWRKRAEEQRAEERS